MATVYAVATTAVIRNTTSADHDDQSACEGVECRARGAARRPCRNGAAVEKDDRPWNRREAERPSDGSAPREPLHRARVQRGASDSPRDTKESIDETSPSGPAKAKTIAMMSGITTNSASSTMYCRRRVP